ncbi:4-oxalomesaconate tautomerase [Homoserinimonas aerilata]|uniref:4-oxalomesaconate tautomerase n=1 Tax=Homoserinimonas aerilata TaxID=1162970 RepID=A0A542YAA5_9MICO|nr:4-oxalomesaconate tautomerase [Homoserinimonas aerilata]TQL45040.1 4-oxalomesaconate tautomerase [Homoserinimonas aerilata]
MNTEIDGIPCMLMRGGTSKGAYFLAEDLPGDRAERDDLLLRIMGSPDARQIDGIGGAHPLTSKVGVVSRSSIPGVDVDYLFLQVYVDEAIVSDQQNCGNILAGIGPFAIERGLVPLQGETTRVSIAMVNTDGRAVATVQTPDGRVEYAGDVEIAGVPGGAAPVILDFESAEDTGSVLLPTGNTVDMVDGVEVSCVDNGMPVVVMRASDLGITGRETPVELEENAPLREKLERIRLLAGELMGLGDVTDTSVPKMSMLSAPVNGGSIATRTFIPHRCHTSIGVLGAASVAVACAIEGTPANSLVAPEQSGARYRVEHPTGHLDVEIDLDPGERLRVSRTGVVRTARKLFDGRVFPRA